MSRGVYTLLLRLLAPLIWLWMARRARRAGGDWQIFSGERFGRYAGRDVATPVSPSGAASAASAAGGGGGPQADAGAWHGAFQRPVWVHAVSLGETRAAQPLLRALLDRGLPVLLTHTTATGRAEGARLFAAELASGQLAQAWMPYDFPGSARRFLAHWRPRCGVLIEREVWPNLLAQARRAGVPMVLASARFSESSLKQACWMGQALREALAGLDAVLAQTEDDAARLRQAGANNVSVAGNLKFDVSPPAEMLARGRAWRSEAGRPVLAIASTREGEDAMFVQLLASGALEDAGREPGAPSGPDAVSGQSRLGRDAASRTTTADGAHAGVGSPAAGVSPLVWLIPRHPQRFDEAAAQLEAAGMSYVRRSRGDTVHPPAASVRVALGDTLGEMPFYYGASDVAIVAGSFAPLGGQNLIEACAAGVPVIVGPHTHNFADAVRDAVAAGAALQVEDVSAALREARRLLADPAARGTMAQAAQHWTASHAGATRRMMEALPLD